MFENKFKSFLMKITAGVAATLCAVSVCSPMMIHAEPYELPQNMTGQATYSGGWQTGWRGWEMVECYSATATNNWTLYDTYQDFLKNRDGQDILILRSKYYNPRYLIVSVAQNENVLWTIQGDWCTICYNMYNIKSWDTLMKMYIDDGKTFKKYMNAVYALYPVTKTWIDISPEEIRYQIQKGTIQDKGIPYYCNAGATLSTPSGGGSDILKGAYTGVGAVPKQAATTNTTTAAVSLQQAVAQLAANPVTVYNGVDYSKEFNAAYYYAANPDLQTAIGANAQALLKHYVEHGKAEGRPAIQK